MDDRGPAAGWYDDTQDQSRERYWDGERWTEHRRVRQTTVQPPPPAPSGHEWRPPTKAEQAAARKRSRPRIILGVVLLAAIATICGVAQSSDEPSDVTAFVMCHQFVEDRLKAPATAEFPLISGATVTGGPTTWKVQSHVDSENGFGAMVRTRFTCSITHQGDDRWRLNELTTDE